MCNKRHLSSRSQGTFLILDRWHCRWHTIKPRFKREEKLQVTAEASPDHASFFMLIVSLVSSSYYASKAATSGTLAYTLGRSSTTVPK
ncbi:hypothetical protein K402DRAFT_71461 [Aulographum hederae CBS 113979]|uniref:Uncharacterized protein n=1 Tax=Aulographum hederae CBS 113979 TaxID=1176131 RepID=A0A6G1HFQ1_9PEZI|nr:hypothetical protein K402DRAFT_71461 [Aulographum hederae CBS 113979]